MLSCTQDVAHEQYLRRASVLGKKNVTQRITWMPRLCIPMKDVASCVKLRSAARQALTAVDLRMGKPLESHVSRPYVVMMYGGILRELKHLSTWGKEII